MMNVRVSKTMRFFAFAILVFSFSACSLKTPQSSSGNTSTPPATLVVEPATSTPQILALSTYAPPLDYPTSAAVMTPLPPLVTITAGNGDLYIRRGSGSDFNPIGVLAQGQTESATGRDILDQWLYVPLPTDPEKFGWVSTLTIYSSISGDTMGLPVVDSPLAVPAFIQNCSIHNMLVQPAGVIIPPGNQFPDNIVRFDPGEYTIHDYDIGKNTQGMMIDLSEGETYQITAKGTVAQHKCPENQ
jgi:hypothetical protein